MKSAPNPRSAAPSPGAAAPSSRPTAPRPGTAASSGRGSWLKRFDSDLSEDVMGWAWVIGLGLTALGTVVTGGLALAIGLGSVDVSDCAWAVFVAAGLGATGLLVFIVAVLIALLK